VSETKAKDYQEPWTVEGSSPAAHTHWIKDRDGADRLGFVPSRGHDRPSVADRAVRCVNFLRGVPDEFLDRYTVKEGERPDEGVAMFLAYLGGHHDAALAYADEVQAKAVASERFVRRDELVAANAQLAVYLGVARKALRTVMHWSGGPGHVSRPPDEYVVKADGLMRALDAVRAALARTKI